MLRHQGYTFRLRGLDAGLRQALAREAGQCRWLWNNFLELDRERRAAGKKLPGYAWRCRALTFLRRHPDYLWLAEGSVVAQQRVLRELGRAWDRFFEDARRPVGRRLGTRLPVYKKKGERDAFGWSGRAWVEVDPARNRVRLPKLGWVRYRNSRRILGEVVNATVRRCGRRWDISLGTEREVAAPASRQHIAPVGLDVGIASLARLSDGGHIHGPRAQRRFAAEKARAQRIEQRRKRGSRRRQRQSWKVAKISRRAANVRRDCLHKATTQLAKSHGMVAVEALRVGSMTRSARGSVEAPGSNVRAKTGLNREILDQGWGEMRRQLAYKLGWSGGRLVAVSPRHTSQRCSACGHTERGNRRTQAKFACLSCGHVAHADVNAARNILAAGMAAIAAGHVAENAGGGDGTRPANEPCSLVLRARIPAL